jgi:hypothetical protein
LTDNELGGVRIYGTSRTICYGATNLRCALPDHLRIPGSLLTQIKMLKTDLGKVAGRVSVSRVIICCKSEKYAR